MEVNTLVSHHVTEHPPVVDGVSRRHAAFWCSGRLEDIIGSDASAIKADFGVADKLVRTDSRATSIKLVGMKIAVPRRAVGM